MAWDLPVGVALYDMSAGPRVEGEWVCWLWGGGVGRHAGHVWDSTGWTRHLSEVTAKSGYGGIWARVPLWVTAWLWVTR